MTYLGSTRPPLLLLYLLLSIPAARRVSVSDSRRLGVGIIDPPSQSLAVVSVRSPWKSGTSERAVRARWRLDAYGDDIAATELDQRVTDWQELDRAGHNTLQIAAEGRGRALRLTFGWSERRDVP